MQSKKKKLEQLIYNILVQSEFSFAQKIFVLHKLAFKYAIHIKWD